jgi:hypothetical protein
MVGGEKVILMSGGSAIMDEQEVALALKGYPWAKVRPMVSERGRVKVDAPSEAPKPTPIHVIRPEETEKDKKKGKRNNGSTDSPSTH